MYSLLVLTLLSMCDCTSLSYQYQDIATKSKIELSPVQITCRPNDVVVLSTPIVNCDDVLYRLYRPNGDIIRTNFSGTKSKLYRFYNTNSDDESNNELQPSQNKHIIKYINNNVKAMYPKQMNNIINDDNSEDKRDDTMQIEEKQMNGSDFMIGPLLEEDHGNWVLSIYCKDVDGEWIEMFQVITITLITSVQMKKTKVMLREGSTFNLSFMYPIKELETCELTVPAGSTDRYFDRSRIELDHCGYVVTNITQNDHGTWRVIGVGKIVYEGMVFLYVVDHKTPELDLSDYDEYKNNDENNDNVIDSK